MKLKKIAALALAGVMAVSMLAGCAGKGTGDKSETTELTAAVVAQLNSDTTKKASFGKSTALQATLDKAVQSLGDSATSSGTILSKMLKVDTKLSKDAIYSTTSDKSWETYDKATDAVTGVVGLKVTKGMYTDEYIAKELAGKLETATVANPGLTIANLPTASVNNYTDSETGKQYYYTFSYQVDLASKVVEMVTSDTDVYYFVAYTVTRTPAKTAVHER